MALSAGQQAVIAALEHSGLPVTRENYIAFDLGDAVPDPWTAEDEAGLPDFLQVGYEPPATSADDPKG